MILNIANKQKSGKNYEFVSGKKIKIEIPL